MKNQSYNRNIELLAPAGSLDSMKAAIHAGCDAVYMGGTQFSARAFAQNLSVDELVKAIEYCHLRKVSFYLTVNTLLKNDELYCKLYDMIRPLYENGLDAVIVQDLGVMEFIHQTFPDLSIHGSTQMAIANVSGVDYLREHGVSRVVLARELSLKEIQRIAHQAQIEVECFVHGAICYCYSGQCLLSSMIGGRSGNRGRCAQPCRLPYVLTSANGPASLSPNQEISHQVKNAKYLLSPKDMCTIEILPEMIKAGIHSFKIEGRMKQPEYVAGVVSLYRKYLDMCLTHPEKKLQYKTQDLQDLMDLYNRGGFCTGYYQTQNGRHMISYQRPNHIGVKVGTVVSNKRGHVSVKLCQDISGQDVLEINQDAEKIHEFTVKEDTSCGQVFTVDMKDSIPVKANMEVFRTKNAKLLHAIRKQYIGDGNRPESEKRIKVEGHLVLAVGSESKLSLMCDSICVTVKGERIQEAETSPVTVHDLMRHMQKTGNTPFDLHSIIVSMNGNEFMPVGAMKELRRKGLEQLEKAILSAYDRAGGLMPDTEYMSQALPSKREAFTSNRIHVLVTTVEQFMVALNIHEIDRIYLELSAFSPLDIPACALRCHQSGKEFYLAMPYVCRMQAEQYVFDNIDSIFCQETDGFLVRNLDSLELIKKQKNCHQKIISDYLIYTMNDLAAAQLYGSGVTWTTVSPELTFHELQQMQLSQTEVVVYGKIPLMVSAQCVCGNTLGCRQMEEEVYLQDRKQMVFLVKNYCRFCYNIIYNSKRLYLADKLKITTLRPFGIRLQFVSENESEMTNIVNDYIRLYKTGQAVPSVYNDITRGHMWRGVE